MSKNPIMFDNNEYCVNSQGSGHQEQQNVQKMQKKFSEVKITCAPGTVEQHSQKYGQQQKDECMYCGSNNLVQANNQMLCHDCFAYQEEPFPAILPKLTVSTKKVIVSGLDGPYEKEVREGRCTYCLHEELLTMPGDKFCSVCCNPELFRKMFSCNLIN